nr:hypothetical protein BaRGS_028346 [Batillaria attramentaria]
MTTILDSRGLQQSDPRLKTLSAGSWKALYKAVLGFQQGSPRNEDQQPARRLLFAIQQCLQAVNASIPQATALPISRGMGLEGALQEPDMVPCIRDKAIRQVVQTLGRFMAAYFSNQPVYIFPPHNPHPLPAIHFEANILNNRILPKYHSEISTMVRQQKLSSIWTVERALEYLLLSGLVCEAAWFADQMGNWKTGFQLATACFLHQNIAPKLYQK